jgi:SAM-dependent methyltransferase
MNPQISPNEIGKFYPSDYGPHQAKPKEQYLDADTLRRKYKKRPFAAFVFAKLDKSSRLLDVGCGNGSFLNEIKAMTGCQVYGLDFSDVAAKTVKENFGLDIHIGTILDAPFPTGYFDVITAWEYLEHVSDPSEVLLKISSLLKNDGSCIISTPNFDSFNCKLFKDKWYGLDCPRHIYIYTPKTITGLLQKSGLSIEKIKYPGSSKGLLGSLQYYFYGGNYNSQNRDRIRRSSLLKKIVSPWTMVMALIKQSDRMVIYAKKAC